MELIVSAFIFCIVLFLYLHIQFHLKTSDELEVYEIEQYSKEKMEEICDLRQPVLFDLDETTDKITLATKKDAIVENYSVFEVKVRNSHDERTILPYLPLQLKSAIKLFEEDKSSEYFSENNTEFLAETGVLKHFQYNDEFLRPHLVSNCYYDIIFGSQDVTTPFRYDINYRNYFMVTQGELRVKMTPPKSAKYLCENKDYELMEFVSPINPWSPSAKHKADFEKVKCLEIVLHPGKCLHIPAYWWYSFKLNKDTGVSSCKYRTYMNNVAVLPHIGMHLLQNQNVSHKIAKYVTTAGGDATGTENMFNQEEIKEEIKEEEEETMQRERVKEEPHL
jgi:hypothetical protein